MAEQPDSSFEWPQVPAHAKQSQILYEFEYLPTGLFNRAQVRLYQLTNNKIIWKNGSLLKKNKHLALITRTDKTINVKVQGAEPENIIFLFHEVIEVLITESFNGVGYDFSFPCPDCYNENSIDSMSMYSAALIRRAYQMKASFLQCRHHFHVIPIAELSSRMPPDSTDASDLQLRKSLRELKHLKQKFTYDIVIIYSMADALDTTTIHPRQIKQDMGELLLLLLNYPKLLQLTVWTHVITVVNFLKSFSRSCETLL